MNKAVIKIVSNATMEGNELIEVMTIGSFEKKDDEYVAKYKETEISGMEGTETTLRIGKERVILEREGSTTTKMEFKKGESSVCLYNTPYGILELGILTKDLEHNISENGGNVAIEYEMIVDGEEPLKTKIQIGIDKK